MALTLGALALAGTGVVATFLNAVLELIRKVGAPAYFLVVLGILYADVSGVLSLGLITDVEGAGNVFGGIVSFFTVNFYGITVTSLWLFVGTFVSFLILILWSSKKGLKL